MARKKKASGGLKTSGSPHAYMLVDIGDIEPYAQNAKKHPPWHVKQIKDSIEEFGFMSPIIVSMHNGKYQIIAGHGRYAAAVMMELKQVPVILIDTLTETQIRAYRLADNQISLNTGYDENILRVELQELDKLELEFDLEITGFATGELDVIIGSDAPDQDDEADKIPEIEELPVTKTGDLWILGNHRLLCGNALIPANYQTLMNGETADAVFSDPPYNVPVNGHVCGNGKIKHDEFAMACGEMSDEEFEEFLTAFIALVIEFSRDGSLHYICMDWRGIYLLLSAAKGQYKELKNICIWNKSNGGMGSLYRSKHEFIPVFKNGSAPHINNVALGVHGRYRSNIWDYRGVNSFDGKEDLKLHPTVKPSALVADAIMDCTHRGGLVLDPFGGSGSTLIAAEMTGRCARLMELEPKYVDVTIRRWKDYTGLEAVHAETGKTFDEIQAEQGE